MLTSSGGTGSPGASTTPLHARPAASTVVDHPLRDPGGHWRPGGGDSAKRKAPDRWSSNEVSAKRSGGQSRRSALSGRPLIACQSDPAVVRCGTPAPNWYSTINPPPLTSTPVSAPASLSIATVPEAEATGRLAEPRRLLAQLGLRLQRHAVPPIGILARWLYRSRVSPGWTTGTSRPNPQRQRHMRLVEARSATTGLGERSQAMAPEPDRRLRAIPCSSWTPAPSASASGGREATRCVVRVTLIRPRTTQIRPRRHTPHRSHQLCAGKGVGDFLDTFKAGLRMVTSSGHSRPAGTG